ncbi:hypothetical protein H2201_003494 [Coniosporium apollinis]|uniref:Uncharacterized protein n=1 Tax=Coniosporium apollinis TaxID=61459 RepID=A0ABQ9NZ12_9PEZI|nr:hypothetical protein H2201_003494 [Coniosporium apollinis]
MLCTPHPASDATRSSSRAPAALEKFPVPPLSSTYQNLDIFLSSHGTGGRKKGLQAFRRHQKKHTSGLTALTEKNLAEKAGHLEMLRGGKKDKKGGKGAEKKGEKGEKKGNK